MHKVAPQIASMVHIPIIHIADATVEELETCHIQRAGLLGTKYTMTQEFYRQKLINRGMDVVIPDETDMDVVNDIIFHELCVGKMKKESRKKFQRIIDSLKDQGAEGVILGCTEIGLPIQTDGKDISVISLLDGENMIITGRGFSRCGHTWCVNIRRQHGCLCMPAYVILFVIGK